MSESYTAVGMVEFNSIAAGIDAADQMVKTAQVDPLFFKTICPGQVRGRRDRQTWLAVSASVNAGRETHADALVDWFIIPNIHRDVIGALAGATGITERGALGIIETFSAASIVVASDAAVKAADVQLLDVRVALGLGGKGYALMTGRRGRSQRRRRSRIHGRRRKRPPREQGRHPEPG